MEETDIYGGTRTTPKYLQTNMVGSNPIGDQRWLTVDEGKTPPQAFRGRPYPGEIRRLKDAEDPEMTLPAMLNAGTSGVELNSGKGHQQETGINSENGIRRGLQFQNAQLVQSASPK